MSSNEPPPHAESSTTGGPAPPGKLSSDPPRQKVVTYDPEVISRNLMGASGIPPKYLGHRKSSIPFNDRAPKVRFLRLVEPHGVNDLGSHIPIITGPNEGLKPILKKTEFPILIDTAALAEPSLVFSIKEGGSTNDALEGCINFAEHLILHFSKGDREARGALDILTFPVAIGLIEPLSRFQGSMVVGILAIDKLKLRNKEPDKQLFQDIAKVLDTLLIHVKKNQERAHNLLVKAKQRYAQWSQLLSRKGEFQIEHSAIKIPIYTRKTMPESVTLYEDVIEEEKRYLFDGAVRVYRSANDIMLVTDIRKAVCMKYCEHVESEQLAVIAETVLEHAKDLVHYSGLNLEMALDTLNQKIFDLGFRSMKDKITTIEFDAFFDPLCALELKTALGDIVTRKGELLNTAEHIVNNFKWMEKFINTFLKYCKQDSAETKKERNSETKGCCGGCRKCITAEKLLDLLQGLGHIDFMVSIPLTVRFSKSIFESCDEETPGGCAAEDIAKEKLEHARSTDCVAPLKSKSFLSS